MGTCLRLTLVVLGMGSLSLACVGRDSTTAPSSGQEEREPSAAILAAAPSNAIWLEAEAGVLTGSPTFAVNNDSNASGGKYIQATSNSLTSAGPNRATYTFSATAGSYKVWGRALTPTLDNNSLWVSMDGGAFVKWNDIPVRSSWGWDDVHNSDNGGAVMTYNLSQGNHTLVVANRENGTKLDKLYITAKGDTPSGMGGCNPTTCADQGAQCGTISDGCGGTLTCGSCAPAYTCFGNTCICVPKTCASIPAACGNPGDACGGTLSCGTCPVGQACNANYQCACAPTTCQAQGAQCGTISDGCGGTLTCGSCPPAYTCFGNACICIPKTCASIPAACGNPNNACGGTLSCGTCPTGQVCNLNYQCVADSPGNIPPVVNAGIDVTIALPAALLINGTVVDDGLPAPPALAIAWTKISGPGTVTFTPANAASTTITFSSAGTYVLRLSANDGLLSASDDVQITCITPTNTAPVVNAGIDVTLSRYNALLINGTVTDDGLPFPPTLTIAWTKTSGPGTVTFSSTTTASTTVSFSAAGVYGLRLSASDGALSTSDDVQITVIDDNTAPVVSAGIDVTIALPAVLLINGSATDDGLPRPPALAFAWTKTSGPGTVTFTPANAATTTISFSSGGVYVLRLTANDGALSGYDEVQITVIGANTPPSVNAGSDRTVTLPSTLTIAGSVTDDGQPTPPTLTSAWTKTSGNGTVTFNPANAATTTASFSAAGVYVLRLTGSDGALTAYDEVQVTVSAGGNNPCDGLCSPPTNFTMNGSYSSGNLGTGAVCRQTTSAIHSGNCGNFAGARTLSVNGTKMTCNGGSWSTVPAARNGGYCVSVSSGDYAWGYFSLW